MQSAPRGHRTKAELAKRGDLYDRRTDGPLPESDVHRFYREQAEAAYLERHGITWQEHCRRRAEGQE